MIIYIIYKAEEESLARACRYSILHHAPTLTIRQVHENTPVVKYPEKTWIVCCSPRILFVDSPLLLLEYVHPRKIVLKVHGYTLDESPLTVWNSCQIPDTDVYRLRYGNFTSEQIGNLPEEWASKNHHKYAKALLFSDSLPPEFLDLWNGYADGQI